MNNIADLDFAFEQRHSTKIARESLPGFGKDILPYGTKMSIDLESKRNLIQDPTSLDWQFDPVGFKTFCESKEHMNLLPRDFKEGEEGALSFRQYNDCMQILGDDPKRMFDPSIRRYKMGGLLWAKGCIAEDTLLCDEKTKKTYTVREIVDKKIDLHIKCYDETTKTVVVKQVNRVFSKGISKLIQINLSSGKEITVAPDHEFFNGTKYQKVKDLRIGNRIYVKHNGLYLLERITVMDDAGKGEIFDLTIDDETPNYFTANGILNHNSGKDYVCALVHAYLSYILLCLKDPAQFFGFGTNEPCDILNIGSKGKQAEKVYFEKFRSRLLSWKWMMDKYNIIDRGKVLSKKGKLFPTCKILTRSVEWMDKKVRAFSENSGSPQSLEGYNIIFYICDEISGWTSDIGRETARQILSVLRSSQGSRNTRTLMGLGMVISYPRADDDIMFELEKESLEPGSEIFFSRGLQEEIKPKRFYSGKTFEFNAGTEKLPDIVKVPVELDEGFFKKNPEDAKMFYLLRPPAVGEQWAEYPDKIDLVLRPERQKLFKVETEYVSSSDGTGAPIYYVRENIVGLNRNPNMDADYVAWIDAGESTCDASLSFGHLEWVKLIEGSVSRDVECVVLDDTLVWEPNKKLKRIVDIGSMAKVCIDTLKYIPLKAVWWDQWNSGTGIFELRQRNILCDKHNLNGDDYNFFKTIIYTNRFIAPNVPEVVKGVEQVKHLSRTRTNNVEPGSSKHKKDISDTWCGITTLLLGSLVQHIQFRRGRATAGITIGTTGKPGQGIQGTQYRQQQNPFSNPAAQQFGKRVIHSDLFPGIGQNRGGTPAPRKSTQQSRFPRGIRM